MAVRQSGAISNSRRRRSQVDELNARQHLLPTIMANKQRAEGIAREDELNKIQQQQFSRQHQLSERQFAFNKSSTKKARRAADRASEIGLGLEAGRLGIQTTQRYGGSSITDTINSGRGLFGGSVGTFSPTSSAGQFLGNLSLGSAIGGGMAGYGASKLLGKKKSKVTKGLLGAGLGAAMGFLSGGPGGGLSGAFGGGLGGLFG